MIEIPGHTYGSVAFLDRKNRLLLSGDSVQKEGPIYLFGGHRNLDLYIESQKKLLALGEQVEEVLPCHQASPIGPEYIGRNLEDAVALRAGRLEGKQHPFLPCCSYRGKMGQNSITNRMYEGPSRGRPFCGNFPEISYCVSGSKTSTIRLVRK